MDKEAVIHIHNGVLLSHKKDEIMPFAATWMDLEILIVRQISYDVTYMWNLKKKVQINLLKKQKQTHRYKKKT